MTSLNRLTNRVGMCMHMPGSSRVDRFTRSVA